MSAVSDEVVGACTAGDVDTLYQFLSQQGELVNMTSEGDVTLLMHTIIGAGTSESAQISGRHVECCALLVQAGAELEIADTTYGRTAAHWAVYYHRDDILSVLIEAGCDLTCPDYAGTSPFFLALQESATGCLAVALQLLPREILDMPHPQFLLPFLHAVQLGNKEACQLMVQAGANVNQVDEESGCGPLHFATEQNNKSLVDFLLACGAELDVADRRGLTPLHIASIVEGAESLEAIVKRVGGEEVLDIRDSSGLTPLMHACLYGNLASVKLLLRKKADVTLQDSEGKHCLHYAAESGTQLAHECVQLICKKNKQLLETKDSLGRSPLHSCAASGTVQTLDVLLTSGCSLDSLDSSHRGVVHWAAVSGNPPVLAKVLELGSPVDPLDEVGSTPLHYAVHHSAEPTPEVYSDEAQYKSQLVQQCVGMLLEAGASVEQRDGQGYLPLHSAVQLHNNLQACQLLLQHNADPEAKTQVEGLTGLHLAARRGVAESCQLLLEQTGGRVGTVLDQEGASALHYAVQSGEAECVEYLLQAGLSPNLTDKDHRTPCHVAASAGLTPCLQVLKGYGANLSAVDVDGATPLHEAAASGHISAVEFLLSSDNTHINKGAGQSQATPLHYTVQGGYEECVQLLLDWGAEVNPLTISESEYLSPLDLCDEQNTITHNLLIQHGGLPGVEVARQRAEKQDTESALPGEEVDGTALPEDETLSVPTPRPTTPSRRSFVTDPVFETDRQRAASPPHLSRVSTPVTPPPTTPTFPEGKRPGTGILKKAFSMMRKKAPSQQPPESILSSVVGLYAAQMTMLAAAVVGTSLGDKMREVAEKVATDTAEELKKTATLHEGEFPELVWLHEEVDAPRTPTPTPPPPTPPPPTPPPPIPKVTEDPYERRMRKAKAQLDMSKSPGYLALEELLKAQDTHMKLKRQFQEEKIKEFIRKRREYFQAEELNAKKASDKVNRRLEERMKKAKSESEAVNKDIATRLSQAREENDKLSQMMGELGVNPRPTVAQWLQRKQMERKAKLQDSLINWDRGRRRRQAAILVEQTMLSQRAMRHAAWGAKKELRSKLQTMKKSPYNAVMKPTFPQIAPHKSQGAKRVAQRVTPRQGQKAAPPSTPPPTPVQGKPAASPPVAGKSSVLATPVGFRKVRDPGQQTTPTRKTPTSNRDPLLWKIGEDYVVKDKLRFPTPPSQDYLRAIGPKTVHAERTLHFLSPQDYRAAKAADRATRKQLSQQYGVSLAGHRRSRTMSPVKSAIVISSINYDPSPIKRGVSFTATTPTSSARYHSHADKLGRRTLQPAKEESSQTTRDQHLTVLPMNVIEPTSVEAA